MGIPRHLIKISSIMFHIRRASLCSSQEVRVYKAHQTEGIHPPLGPHAQSSDLEEAPARGLGDDRTHHYGNGTTNAGQ